MMIHPYCLLNVTSRRQKSNLVATHPRTCAQNILTTYIPVCTYYFDFSLSVKAAPHECVIRTGLL